MQLTYRQARRAKRALDEISIIRDGGLAVKHDDRQGTTTSYMGKLILPRRAKLRIRAMKRVLDPIEDDLSEQEREIMEEANKSLDMEKPESQRQIQQQVLALLDSHIEDAEGEIADLAIAPLKATDLGDKALDHIPPTLLGSDGLGPLFEDNEDVEDGAGDPRNREERRSG